MILKKQIKALDKQEKEFIGSDIAIVDVRIWPVKKCKKKSRLW